MSEHEEDWGLGELEGWKHRPDIDEIDAVFADGTLDGEDEGPVLLIDPDIFRQETRVALGLSDETRAPRADQPPPMKFKDPNDPRNPRARLGILKLGEHGWEEV